MNPRLLNYAEQNVPRYTSYPTAPHFNAAVDGAVFRNWLGELAPDASLSLYLHTPYCRDMCWYCGCHAFLVRRDEPITDFVEAIQAEIDTIAAATPARNIVELHWGGGTPNVLCPERFEAIIACLRECFDLSACARHAVEIDPRLLTRAQAEAFARSGVNRVSLGVQDLDARVQEAVGRVQHFSIVETAVATLRAAGIQELSFDLLYGLPHQTPTSVRRTAELAASLRPARFSVFGYAHVPWFKSRQRLIDEAALPDAGARLALAAAIGEELEAAGYVAIGYDHYALPDDPIAKAAREGALERNFQGFVETAADVLIGVGPSAISTLPHGYAQNEPEVGAWSAAVLTGGLATKRGRALTEEDRRRRGLITRLLCDFAVDLADHGGADAFARELDDLEPLARDGLVRIEGGRLTIPSEARAFTRVVAQVFDAYRNDGAARHSRAV